jgi:hypothetical protein
LVYFKGLHGMYVFCTVMFLLDGNILKYIFIQSIFVHFL